MIRNLIQISTFVPTSSTGFVLPLLSLSHRHTLTGSTALSLGFRNIGPCPSSLTTPHPNLFRFSRFSSLGLSTHYTSTSVMGLRSVLVGVALLGSLADAASSFSPARPPAIPLAVKSPYLNSWLNVGSDGGNGGYLAGEWPKFWRYASPSREFCFLSQANSYAVNRLLAGRDLSV